VDQITRFIELLNWLFRRVAGLLGRGHEVEKAKTDGDRSAPSAGGNGWSIPGDIKQQRRVGPGFFKTNCRNHGPNRGNPTPEKDQIDGSVQDLSKKQGRML